MDNSGLREEVRSLQNTLLELERQNRELQSEIYSAVNGVNKAENDLAKYNKHIRDALDSATNSINNSTNRALSAYKLQGQIDQLYTRYKAIELANKNIRALNNKKYYDFNNYRVIRKIVKGIMDNLDLNMVSDLASYKSVERQHLITPDFWLTCALISIMAWKFDDKQLAERAVEQAYKFDKKNSSIFYMIFNLRMDRNDAAIKWFLEYQKCQLKGSDDHTFLMMFSLISKTLMDRVDDETSRMIEDYIHNQILDCADKDGFSEQDIIGLIKRKMVALIKKENYHFPTLSKYCTEYNTIQWMLKLSQNNNNILEFILQITNVPVTERNTYLKEYINELLELPNDVEKEVYEQIEYNELVIKCSGDISAAKRQFEEKKKNREDDINIIKSIISWVYDFTNEDINGQMKLNMFTLIKSFQEKAIHSYFEDYRNLNKKEYLIKVNDYSSNTNFEHDQIEKAKIEKFYAEKQAKELATIKNIGAYLSIGGGIICGIAAFFTSFLFFIGLAIGLIVGMGMIISNNKKKKIVIDNIQNQKTIVLEAWQQMCNEYRNL